MELKTVLRSAGLVLTPACACLIITAGCATESEIPLPPGAYVAPPEKQVPPENSALYTEPAPRPARREDPDFPKDSDEQVFTLERLSESEAPERSAPAPKKSVPAKKTRPVFAKDDIVYKIRKNDTLGGIARRHGMSAHALAEYNGISLKSKIYPGRTLHIPAGVKSASKVSKPAAAIPAGASVYTVRSGDTLGGIAQKHSVRTAELVAANDLDVRKPIRAGQKLIIPAGAKKTVPAAAAEPAKKTPAPAVAAAKKTPATAAKPEPAKPAPAEKAGTAPAGQKSADDLLKSIGSDSADHTGPAQAAPAAGPEPAKGSGSVSVAPPAREEAFDADNTIEVNIEREMTLEETAKAFDRSYSTVKKLNPSINPDVRLKAGTAVKIPIF